MGNSAHDFPGLMQTSSQRECMPEAIILCKLAEARQFRNHFGTGLECAVRGADAGRGVALRGDIRLLGFPITDHCSPIFWNNLADREPRLMYRAMGALGIGIALGGR